MARSRLAHRADGNHKELVSQLRDIPGMAIIDTSAYGMSVDLLVVWRERTGFIEVKNPDKATKAQKQEPVLMLTDAEIKLRDSVLCAGGLYIIAFCVDDVLKQWPNG